MKNVFFALLIAFVLNQLPCSAQWTKLQGAVGGGVFGVILTDDYFLATAKGGVYRSEDQGQTWANVPIGQTGDGWALIRTDDGIYCSIAPRGIFLSIDSGRTWRRTRYGKDSTGSVTQCFGVWHGRLYAGGYHPIREYRDSLWQSITNEPNRDVRAIATDDRALFKGTQGYGVVSTTDGGASWSKALADGPAHEVRSLLIHGDTVLAGFDTPPAVHRSTDHGQTWTVVPVSGDMYTCYGFVEVNGILFGGGKNGVFRSVDFGQTWDSVRTGLRDVGIPLVYCLVVHGSYLYAGTSNAWIWRRPLSELLPPTTGVDEASTGANITSLEGAVPNPSSGTVVLPYRLGTSCSVNLAVYNAVGERVAVLVNERQGAGSHSATFDVSALPASVYYYRLSAGGTVLSRSMIVAR